MRNNQFYLIFTHRDLDLRLYEKKINDNLYLLHRKQLNHSLNWEINFSENKTSIE